MYVSLLAVAAVLLPWGELLQLGAFVAAPGIAAGAAIVLGVVTGRVIVGFHRFSAAMTSFIVYVFLSFSSSLPAAPLPVAVSSAGRLLAYLVLVATTVGFALRPVDRRLLIRAYVASTACMVAVAVVDYYGLADFEWINTGSTLLVYEEHGVRAMDLSGAFQSRTGLATQLSLAMPLALGVLVLTERRRDRLLWGILTAMLGLATVMSLSRGLMLAATGAAVYLAVGLRRRARTRALLVPVWVVATVLASLALWNPSGFRAAGIRVSSLQPTEILETPTDMLRVRLLEATLRDLVDHPWGLGFSEVALDGERWNVHNSFTFLLRAAGPLGLVFLSVAAWPVARRVFARERTDQEIVMYSSLLSYGIFGLAHNIVFALFAWIVIGCALTIISERNRAPS